VGVEGVGGEFEEAVAVDLLDGGGAVEDDDAVGRVAFGDVVEVLGVKGGGGRVVTSKGAGHQRQRREQDEDGFDSQGHFFSEMAKRNFSVAR
jgi:hypothetical protein